MKRIAEESHGNMHFKGGNKMNKFGFAWSMAAVLLLSGTLSAEGADKASISRGKKIYVSKCQNCHGSKGNGKTKVGRSMNIGRLSPSMDEGEMIAITQNGKGSMPAYSKSLSKKKVQDVVNYIKTF